MVCPQVVNLPPEHLCPEVFTDELHYIQLVLKAGRVPGHPGQSERHHRLLKLKTIHVTQCVHTGLPLNESLSHSEAHALEDRNTNSSVLRGRIQVVQLARGQRRTSSEHVCMASYVILDT